MEDWNMLAADCVVISCCCQCLILQIIAFILISLPCKLFQKAKEFVKQLRRRRKEDQIMLEDLQEEFVEFNGGSISMQVEGFSIEGHDCECMDKVEEVLEEFSQKGEFAFGSFWGRERIGSSSTCVAKQDLDISVVQYEFIEMVGPFSSV